MCGPFTKTKKKRNLRATTWRTRWYNFSFSFFSYAWPHKEIKTWPSIGRKEKKKEIAGARLLPIHCWTIISFLCVRPALVNGWRRQSFSFTGPSRNTALKLCGA
jgi:hypothetical protein